MALIRPLRLGNAASVVRMATREGEGAGIRARCARKCRFEADDEAVITTRQAPAARVSAKCLTAASAAAIPVSARFLGTLDDMSRLPNHMAE